MAPLSFSFLGSMAEGLAHQNVTCVMWMGLSLAGAEIKDLLSRVTNVEFASCPACMGSLRFVPCRRRLVDKRLVWGIRPSCLSMRHHVLKSEL